jgi:hypothetical protein
MTLETTIPVWSVTESILETAASSCSRLFFFFWVQVTKATWCARSSVRFEFKLGIMWDTAALKQDWKRFLSFECVFVLGSSKLWVILRSLYELPKLIEHSPPWDAKIRSPGTVLESETTFVPFYAQHEWCDHVHHTAHRKVNFFCPVVFSCKSEFIGQCRRCNMRTERQSRRHHYAFIVQRKWTDAIEMPGSIVGWLVGLYVIF